MQSSERAHPCARTPLLRNPCLLPFAALAGVVAAQCVAAGPDPARWDPLLISGTLGFVAAIALAAGLSERTEAALLRAAASHLPPARLAALARRRERRARWLARMTAALLGAAALCGSVMATVAHDAGGWLAISTLCAIAGWIAGRQLGLLIASGPLGWLLDETVSVVARHSGRRAQIVGELFGLQTVLMTLPVVYLGSCALLIHTGVAAEYAHWSDCFTTWFAVSLVVELLCFLLPLLAFATQLWRPARRAGG